MATTLVVEDGSNVANANSFNTLAEIKAYALLRRRTLPDDDELLEGYAIRAMDYLSSFEDQYKGDRTNDDQTLSFPRSDLVIRNTDFPEDEMPAEIKSAQCQLVIEMAAGVILQPTFVLSDRVKRKKIGVLETEWFDGMQSGNEPMVPAVDALLSPLLRMTFGLTTVRV